jgi:hypothetical protein
VFGSASIPDTASRLDALPEGVRLVVDTPFIDGALRPWFRRRRMAILTTADVRA